MAQADKLVELGLRDLGYVYVNIDDCWMAKERDKNGRLVPDPDRFPSGMKALADYVSIKRNVVSSNQIKSTLLSV